jgi:hypothetical protein
VLIQESINPAAPGITATVAGPLRRVPSLPAVDVTRESISQAEQEITAALEMLE